MVKDADDLLAPRLRYFEPEAIIIFLDNGSGMAKSIRTNIEVEAGKVNEIMRAMFLDGEINENTMPVLIHEKALPDKALRLNLISEKP